MGVEVKNSELSSNVRVVRLSGRLDMDAAEADSPVLRLAVDESPAGVIVDMEAVTFLSSSGLRMLIAIRQSALAAGKNVAITRASPMVCKTFKVAGLEDVFRFYESEGAAVEALWQ